MVMAHLATKQFCSQYRRYDGSVLEQSGDSEAYTAPNEGFRQFIAVHSTFALCPRPVG
jgi:hypothetical protein